MSIIEMREHNFNSLLAAWRAIGGYVTGRLKGLVELQAAGLAETGKASLRLPSVEG